MSELSAKKKKAASNKLYYEANKERLIIHAKKYYEDNKDKRKTRNKLYRENNKEKIANRDKLYCRKNPLFAFNRKSIHRIEKAVGKDRIKRAENQLAYTQKQFIAHIESLWLDDMSWDNRNDWHIDHIKPLSLFIKEGITDAKIINALSNLQPLWAHDNLSKGAKYETTSKDFCL